MQKNHLFECTLQMPQWFSTRSALAGATCVAASNVAGVSAVASKRDVSFLNEQVSAQGSAQNGCSSFSRPVPRRCAHHLRTLLHRVTSFLRAQNWRRMRRS